MPEWIVTCVSEYGDAITERFNSWEEAQSSALKSVARGYDEVEVWSLIGRAENNPVIVALGSEK